MRKASCFLSALLAFLLLSLLCSCSHTPSDSGKYSVVTTVFPGYDFAVAAAGEDAEVTLLLPPGMESHSYEPTARDMIALQSCDLLLCVGGESEAWVERLMDSLPEKTTVFRMMDYVKLEEEVHDEAEEEHEHEHEEEDAYDEHVWTSPAYAALLVRKIGETLGELDPGHRDGYTARSEAYAKEIDAIHGEFSSFFEEKPGLTLVFGDRFPFLYFAKTYDVDWLAAFPGCSGETEPSAAAMARMIDRINEDNLPVVFYLELSNQRVAKQLADATGASCVLFHSCHNVSAQEWKAGVTYVSLMRQNLNTLREAYAAWH